MKFHSLLILFQQALVFILWEISIVLQKLWIIVYKRIQTIVCFYWWLDNLSWELFSFLVSFFIVSTYYFASIHLSIDKPFSVLDDDQLMDLLDIQVFSTFLLLLTSHSLVWKDSLKHQNVILFHWIFFFLVVLGISLSLQGIIYHNRTDPQYPCIFSPICKPKSLFKLRKFYLALMYIILSSYSTLLYTLVNNLLHYF